MLCYGTHQTITTIPSYDSSDSAKLHHCQHRTHTCTVKLTYYLFIYFILLSSHAFNVIFYRNIILQEIVDGNRILVTSSGGSPMTLSTMTMVTNLVWGTLAAPMDARVAVILDGKEKHTCYQQCAIPQQHALFIHSGYFYSASSNPLLLRSAPDYSIDTDGLCRG